MSWVSWSEKQTTGNADMDHDHRKLVDLINQLANGMENDKPKAFCSSTLEQFIQELRIHFLAEEELMDRLEYSKVLEHKALHALLLKDVLAFKASYDASDSAEFVTLLVILDSWLNRDIMGADKALASIAAAG